MNMASGTKFIREINDQFLICKICHETYRDPKTLTCLHTFCTDCIQHHVDSERERASRFSIYNRYVNCPLCRKKTEIPNGGVRRLPDNFLVSNLTDVVNRRRSVKKPSCEICQTMRSRTNQACSKCLECSKLLCKTCVELHRKTKVTEEHSLFDIEDEKDAECKVHPDEVVRFYCEPCETCVCILCTFQEHSDHEVCSFSEGFSKNKDALDSLLHRCRDRATDVQSLLNTINKCETMKKETQENIRDLAISYTAQVRSMEKKLLKKVESTFSGSELMAFTQTKDWLQECLDSIQSTCNLTDIILKDRNLEMLLLKKEIHGKLTTLMEPTLPTVPEDLSKEIKFIPGSVKLGYLTVIKDSSDSDSLPSDAKCVHTQTETVCVGDSSTSMDVDVTLPLVERSKEQQTDSPPLTPTSNKEVCTIPIQTRDKGIHAPIVDVKSRGVVTDKKVVHTVKSQTDKLATYDMGNMTTLSNQDACVNTPIFETFEKCSQAYPDVKSRGTLANLPDECLKSGTVSNQSRTDRCNIASPNTPTRSPDCNTTTNGKITEMTKGTDSLFNVTEPRQERGAQTVVTENNPLHKPTKSAGVMTDTYKLIDDSKTSSVRASRHFEDDLCIECKKNKKTFGARKIQHGEPENKSTDFQGSKQNAESVNCKQTRDFGTNPINSTNVCDTTVTKIDTSVEKGTKTVVTLNDAFTTCDLLVLSTDHKCTSTPFIEASENETQTDIKHTKEKATWKFVRQTTQATATENKASSHLLSKETNTEAVKTVNKGSNVKVATTNVTTETLPQNPGKDNFVDSATSTYTLDLTDEKTESPANKVNTVPKLLPIRCFIDEPPTPLIDNYTAMSPVTTQERETSTAQIPLSDRWTCTDVTQLANASTSTNKLITKDKGVVTPRTMTLDQFTNTHIIESRECEIEAVVTTADNETLTDKTVYSDAQTSSETIFTDSTTWIDFQSQQEVNTMTDKADLKDRDIMVRPFMINKRTSTSPGVDRSGKSRDGGCQVEFNPVLTRSLPESLLSFFPGPPTEPYKEISIPVPTMERGTMYSPTLTCDQSTMALSILPTDESLSVYTQTPERNQSDAGSKPFDAWSYGYEEELSYEEKATSTESLVYMGLLSQLDNIDELFFVPNVTLETVSSATSLSDMSMETDHIEMLDQEMCTDQISLYDCGTQTYLTLAPDDEFLPNSENSTPTESFHTSNVIDASTNTLSVRMVCRETCTPPRHHLSKSTMTHYVPKTDKCTNTGRRASRYDLSPISTSEIGVSTDSLVQADKDTMTPQNSLKDISVSTDSVFVDGKMAECIVKLKNVSDRLHSPTQKSPNNNFFSTRNQLARKKIPGLEDMLIKPPENLRILNPEESTSSPSRSLSEDERKRNFQELLLQTQLTLQKPRQESPRKQQPITTLKTKSGDRLAAIEEENYKSRSLPRQFPEREQLTGVRMGRQAMIPNRLPLLRYNSAPGRIATVPTQKLNILPRSPTRLSPVSPTKTPPAANLQEQMPSQMQPLLVADRRSSSQLPSLPVISETRTPSSCSSCSAVSCSSVETSSSGTVSSDVIPQKLVKKPLVTSYSSSSTSSVQSTMDPQKSQKKSAMSFMQRLLPRKKKTSDQPSPIPERPRPRFTPKSPPKKQPESPKAPMSPKKSRPFVYMRQRIFSIQHDGESSKPPKEKQKKGKSKTKSDVNTATGGSDAKKGGKSGDHSPPSQDDQKQLFSIC